MYRFADHFALYGPGYRGPVMSSAEAYRYCERFARNSYENFTVASVLLPRRIRRHFYPIYAYCRWADDLADESGDPATALQRLDWWEGELDRCYQGRGVHPVMVALSPVIERFAIPSAPFRDLLSAFRRDQRQTRYGSFVDLLDYCRCSANPVGRLILYLGGCFDATRADLSDQVCTGLQLANFWQDVDRDLGRLDRVYLPTEIREHFGYADSDLIARRFTPEFRAMMEFLVERTRGFFRLGSALVPMMPRDLQIDIDLFIRGGTAVLDRIEAIGYNVWADRPVVDKRAKLKLLLRSMGAHGWRILRGPLTTDHR